MAEYPGHLRGVPRTPTLRPPNTLSRVNEDAVVAKLRQNQAVVLLVLVRRRAGDEQIVNISIREIESLEYLVDETLKCLCSIS